MILSSNGSCSSYSLILALALLMINKLYNKLSRYFVLKNAKDLWRSRLCKERKRKYQKAYVEFLRVAGIKNWPSMKCQWPSADPESQITHYSHYCSLWRGWAIRLFLPLDDCDKRVFHSGCYALVPIYF